ncbi:hypothetical protein SAMN04488561_1302 [Jiangella alba]|uniref:Uncharacterized protein n=1 Tax=Jiangella alba TaxID=561176 RepID=A0A1H5ISU6_9ACTN|nr:hypothetical protein SAMN04488561_1302 [Jiangella alba]
MRIGRGEQLFEVRPGEPSELLRGYADRAWLGARVGERG